MGFKSKKMCQDLLTTAHWKKDFKYTTFDRKKMEKYTNTHFYQIRKIYERLHKTKNYVFHKSAKMFNRQH